MYSDRQSSASLRVPCRTGQLVGTGVLVVIGGLVVGVAVGVSSLVGVGVLVGGGGVGVVVLVGKGVGEEVGKVTQEDWGLVGSEA